VDLWRVEVGAVGEVDVNDFRTGRVIVGTRVYRVVGWLSVVGRGGVVVGWPGVIGCAGIIVGWPGVVGGASIIVGWLGVIACARIIMGWDIWAGRRIVAVGHAERGGQRGPALFRVEEIGDLPVEGITAEHFMVASRAAGVMTILSA
jgi:hypothetical protein